MPAYSAHLIPSGADFVPSVYQPMLSHPDIGAQIQAAMFQSHDEGLIALMRLGGMSI